MNSTIFTNGPSEYLVSYGVVVCKRFPGVVLDPRWEYSNTTKRHVASFLNLSAVEIRQKINEQPNVYRLVPINLVLKEEL